MIYNIAGIKHCGKSTVAKILSEKMNITFADMDTLIEKKVEMPVRQYYREHGKNAFMKAENDVYLRASDTDDDIIISHGGGMCDNEALISNLEGTVYYLFCGRDVLYSRIIRDGIPAFLNPDDPEGSFRELYEGRDAAYRRICTKIIDTEGLAPNEIAGRILEDISDGR